MAAAISYWVFGTEDAVLGGDQVPGWFGLPDGRGHGGSEDLCGEGFLNSNRQMDETAMNIVGHRVLILFRCGPDEAMSIGLHLDLELRADFAEDRSEDFTGLGRECGNVDELLHLGVVAGLGDDASAIGVAHQDNRAFEVVERAIDDGDVFLKRGQGNLRGGHRKTLMGEVGDYFAPDGAVAPDAVDEQDAGFSFCH